MFSQPYNYLQGAVGVWGIWLLFSLLILFLVQLYYYIIIYGRIPKYRNKKGETERDVEGISVVVIVHENYYFIENTISKIMGQDYDNFELVVVDVASNDDFTDALSNLKDIYPNLTTTKFEDTGRFAISDKMALNVGIKAARYPYIVITTADTEPRSERWLSLMSKGFAKGDVVLGYCALGTTKGLSSRLMRATRLMMGVRYISAAINGRPYRGLLQNIGFSRRLYFDSRGFNHLNMNMGEDDLFIQRIATPDNTSIVMHPNATTVQYVGSGLGWWRKQRRFLGATIRYYPLRTKLSLTTEIVSRLLFVIAVVSALVVSPNEIRVGVVGIWLLRLLVVENAMVRNAKRLGEKGLAWPYILHDFWGPFDQLWIYVKITFFPSSGIWR